MATRRSAKGSTGRRPMSRGLKSTMKRSTKKVGARKRANRVAAKSSRRTPAKQVRMKSRTQKKGGPPVARKTANMASRRVSSLPPRRRAATDRPGLAEPRVEPSREDRPAEEEEVPGGVFPVRGNRSTGSG
jgi:hypothetical protein